MWKCLVYLSCWTSGQLRHIHTWSHSLECSKFPNVLDMIKNIHLHMYTYMLHQLLYALTFPAESSGFDSLKLANVISWYTRRDAHTRDSQCDWNGKFCKFSNCLPEFECIYKKKKCSWTTIAIMISMKLYHCLCFAIIAHSTVFTYFYHTCLYELHTRTYEYNKYRIYVGTNIGFHNKMYIVYSRDYMHISSENWMSTRWKNS